MAKSLDLIGQLGVAKAGIQPLKDTFKSNKGLIKVNNKHLDELKAALTLIKKINNKEVIIKSIGASGILKKAKDNYLN